MFEMGGASSALGCDPFFLLHHFFGVGVSSSGLNHGLNVYIGGMVVDGKTDN